MKRFQVEKTQRGYLAKKRKKPVTQRQYYDQGVPSNVLLPPRTLLAQNILDSHGSSFFDTFSYLNFMKDYFKQNQITTPSFTDPNSLWGKITKWYRKRNERQANIQDMEVKYSKMPQEKVKEELTQKEAKLKELIKRNEGDLDDEIERLKEQIEAMKNIAGEKKPVIKTWEAISIPEDYAPDAFDGYYALMQRNSSVPDGLEEAKKKPQTETGFFSQALETLKRPTRTAYNDPSPPVLVNPKRKDLPEIERTKELAQANKQAEKTELLRTFSDTVELPEEEKDLGAVVDYVIANPPELDEEEKELWRDKLVPMYREYREQGKVPPLTLVTYDYENGKARVLSLADFMDPTKKLKNAQLIDFTLEEDEEPWERKAYEEDGIYSPKTLDEIEFAGKAARQKMAERKKEKI